MTSTPPPPALLLAGPGKFKGKPVPCRAGLPTCTEIQGPGGPHFHHRLVPGLPDGDRGERPLVYVRKLPQHHGCRRENPIGVQKGIEEIDTKKPQVCQSLQEALHAGITDLGHFAGVECFTEANVSVILVKTGIRPTHKAGT